MSLEIILNLLGFVGTAAIAYGFVMVTLGRAHDHPVKFVLINFLGACLLIFPALQSGVLAASLLNLFWIIVSLSTLCRIYFGLGLNRHFLVIICWLLIVLIAYFDFPSPINLFNILLFSSATLSIMLFMLGYHTITSSTVTEVIEYRYYVLTLMGNFIYLPVLIYSENYPTAALQIACAIIGALKLHRMMEGDAFSAGPSSQACGDPGRP